MWSRRDQVQAFQFLRRRIVSAVVLGDANHPEAPNKRIVIAVLSGVGVMALILAGFTVYGFLRPGAAKTWRQPGKIVMEKQTGARYVLGADGRLHPALNYTSARLLAQGGVVSVSANSLRAAPRGRPVGIEGAPDSLPDAKKLVSGRWTVCSAAPTDGGAAPARVTVLLGAAPTGSVVDGAGGLLVRDGRQVHLVSGGRRHRIAGAAELAALGYVGRPVTTVGAGWLGAVPAGADLRFPRIDRRGEPGRRLAGTSTRIGQVFQVENVGTATRYFVLLASGLRAVTATEVALIVGDPRTAEAYPEGRPRPLPLPPAALADAQLSAGDVALPESPPVLAEQPAGGSVCVTADGSAAGPELRLIAGSAVPAGKKAVSVPPRRDVLLADEVYLEPGFGLLARTAETGGAVVLVTDLGVRYPLADPETQAALGYGRATPRLLPPSVLALLPTGVALDRAAATREW